MATRLAKEMRRFGIAFDIDGVLIRGGKALPNASKRLFQLQSQGVPHIFLTNGGGCVEEKKTSNLSTILNVPIDPRQMILAHTPMRELVHQFGDKKVLVMGAYDVLDVAHHYGFKKVVSIQDLAHASPHQYPFVSWPHKPHHLENEPIGAIIIFHDPIHWAQDLQIAIDALVGGDPLGSGHGPQTPLFVSNDDFTFSGAYPVPRFAQGAFTRCLQLLYEQHTGKTLEVTRFGKPHLVQYEFAEQVMREQAPECDRFYGIGDNPFSDIQGANAAGHHWTSVLVRTGVFQSDADNHDEHPGDVVVDSVDEAVEWILIQEGVL
ncbi:HAD-superfamily subfamily IIA hydrolase [Saprolegnia parasitica CBS 223.65]|uniref:HAD-superfamily subfamily IIA hydrolase n=1 Tax=Saprolegnia parasitica (strain CBS 223.65) TaxID=695850 RepID=A0A067C4U4_SAPPC|nr:HAD-superfamily subfamily IIA hydrolase [Saprolegnia parasitica CBS 223.65]KDO25784.1 HAD-superfamily subfamily IIA hydrolase [Saprolegnia parasitica CBS 223.65]|eukprot:XP_012203588.1 HAD-superfamily subfamily IIA hydrolase [Saprolegnia parasitica CBS 223.65]